MKNHIKNYIKIMGLAAVPFGTAQVHGEPLTDYKIKVQVCNEANGLKRFVIEVNHKFDGGKQDSIEFIWDGARLAKSEGDDFHTRKTSAFLCSEVVRQLNNKEGESCWLMAPFQIRKHPFAESSVFIPAIHCDLLVHKYKGGCRCFLTIRHEEKKDEMKSGILDFLRPFKELNKPKPELFLPLVTWRFCL